MAVSFVIDRIACDGFGMCAELVPELIVLDDWGFPIIKPGAVPDRLAENAKRAVAVCPVLALRLQKIAAPAGEPAPSPAAGLRAASGPRAPMAPARRARG